jgi:hypothetical protein
MSQQTISTEMIIKEYAHFFQMVYGKQPVAHYLRDGWFRINGEFVRYEWITQEVENLRHLARRKRMNQSNKNAIQRLIAKLRGTALA